MTDKLGFLNDLMELWRQWGPLAKELIPIIRRLAEEIGKETGQDARSILEMAVGEKAELDVLLAGDLASLEPTQ